jgi:hypothetical protein
LALLLAVLSGTALAEEAQVEVEADLILASNQGTTIDPPSLSAVKDEFASAGIVFSSYKRLSSQKLSLSLAKAAELKLPNQKSALLKLEELKAGTATVKVKAEGTEVAIQLGRQGSVFQRVGAYQNGQLILMLSPVKRR